MLPRKKWCGGISSTKAWPQTTTVHKSACCTFNLKSSPSSTNSRPQAKWSQLVPGPASGSFLSSWFQATNPQDFILPLVYVSLFKWIGRPQTSKASKGTPGIQISWGTQQTEPSEWCEVQPHDLDKGNCKFPDLSVQGLNMYRWNPSSVPKSQQGMEKHSENLRNTLTRFEK